MFSHPTSIPVQRDSRQVKYCYRVRVVIELNLYNGKTYFLLTALLQI